MRLRKLRIAWSVGWGIACVLLIVLWVRSYWVIEAVGHGTRTPSETAWISLQSNHGTLAIIRMKVATGVAMDGTIPNGWFYATAQPQYAAQSSFLFSPFIFRFPAWLPLMLLLGIAVLPWTGRKPRFTLRTLLIATTLIAVLLGLIVWLGS
jgi:hypothetical protein